MKSNYTKKTACPECGSKDNLAWFDDGHAYCFSVDCGYTYFPKQEKNKPLKLIQPSPFKTEPVKLLKVTYQDLPKRGITKETCELYGYGISEYKGSPCQVATYKDQYGKDVAQHIKFPNKKYIWIGDMSKVQLWGQHLCRQQGTGGIYLSVFEGETDCMAASQIVDHKFPCVSIPSGVQSAAKFISLNYPFLDKYCRVVICFDNDKAGEAGAEKAMAALPKGKAAIARLPDNINDVNDLLLAKRGNELRDILWKAQSCRSDHIINGADAWDIFTKETSEPICDYPYPELQKFLTGIYPTQMITIAAGSGTGKSTICRELAYHFLRNGLRVGYLALEESVQRTLMGLVGIDMNIPLHLAAKESINQDELKSSFDKLTSGRNLFLYNHFGSIEPEILINQIRELATVDKVNVVILDHLSIVVSGVLDKIGDERKGLDLITTKLRSLAEETNIALVVVSHLSRPQGKGHEEGADVSLRDIRGSHGLVQTSDVCLSLTRNQVGDAAERSQLQLKILKSRHTGMTGEVDKLLYDQSTGRLIVYSDNIF